MGTPKFAVLPLAAGRARRGRPVRPILTADALDVGRRGRAGCHVADGHRPPGRDRVPHQLVVIGERVVRAAHPERDVVGVLAGDRSVGVTDLDPEGVAVLRGRVLRRRARRRLHGDDVDRSDAVVPRLHLVGVEAVGDVAVDPVVRSVAEVVHDPLIHEQRAGRFDGEVGVVARDLLDGRRDRRQGDAGGQSHARR